MFVHVYLLIKLMLIFTLVTSNIERAFSVMTYENKLRSNNMYDQLLNNCLITYIEDVLFKVSDDNIDHCLNVRNGDNICKFLF